MQEASTSSKRCNKKSGLSKRMIAQKQKVSHASSFSPGACILRKARRGRSKPYTPRRNQNISIDHREQHIKIKDTIQ